ncbi:helix-turn-helix domain-containing protein [Wenyingzhuangia sp. 2_MG-2023]|uniref:helix-turn-helix domain-containing protein n=1 Tax=Wenyingzhuangia sp. 2_MG-2023 TaxID=3062639 RepID=UPI0026E17D9A|nr:helix-turn-helix domain-containing protein [Wenyingzhuangia sp. 2_MG-2023]MDO6737383.1 helix-turn-helix domain-containing protein [Wenyingzhuangia sp. 2_MG-2023]
MSLNKKSPITSESNKGNLCKSDNKDIEKRQFTNINDQKSDLFHSENSPSYFAILPANIRYDKKVIPSAKLLFAEISALSNLHGFCYCSNNYFMNLYNVSIQTINNWLKNLEDRNYIKRHRFYKKGTKQILNRYITIIGIPCEINLDRPIKEILNDNIKTNNKKNINSNIFFKNKKERGCLI